MTVINKGIGVQEHPYTLEKKGYNTNELFLFRSTMPEDLFPTEDCEKLGILPLSVSDQLIVIGAMNPEMEGIKTFVKNLNQKINSTIKVSQITNQEWEKWFSNESSIST